MKLFRRREANPGTAAEWFARVRSGEMDSTGDQAWTEWMAGNADNSLAFDEVELGWELSQEVRDRPQIDALLEDLDRELKGGAAVRPKPKRPGLNIVGVNISWQAGLAAAALVAVCAVTALFLNGRPTVSDYATVIGEQRSVTLADDSTIALNTATHVRVAYSRGLRRIDLLAGEAVFAVTQDAARPFEVHALHGTTTAVGTEFDVQVTGDSAAVSVLKGTVAVRANENSGGGQGTEISAGQAVDYTADGTTSAIRSADASKVRGWMAQRIVFSNVTLADALTDYNRYIKNPIVLGDPALGSRRINGVFKIGDQAAFLGALQQGLHVTARTTDTSIVLEPR